MSQPSQTKRRSRLTDAFRCRALAAVCLLIALGGRGLAQTDERPGPVDTASNPSDDPGDPQASLAFKPVEVRPLTSADLPPSSPLTGLRAAGSSIAFNPDWRASRSQYRAIVEREAQAFGLPAALVDAVMAVESSYNPAVVGLDGEIGLMQVLPSTARMMGFAGTLEQLAQPEINIHYGTAYLAGAWQRADGDLCTATMKYRAGHGETRFSYLSVDYCMRVRNHLMAQGVVVTGSVPQPSFGARTGSGGTHARGPSIGRGGGLNLAALNTQLRAMTDRKSLHALP